MIPNQQFVSFSNKKKTRYNIILGRSNFYFSLKLKMWGDFNEFAKKNICISDINLADFFKKIRYYTHRQRVINSI